MRVAKPSDFIASPLKEEPSPYEVIDAIGEGSEKIVPLHTLYTYTMRHLPAEGEMRTLADFSYRPTGSVVRMGGSGEGGGWGRMGPTGAISAASYRKAYLGLVGSARDFIDGVRVLESSTEDHLIPVWEIHRPHVKGCVATLLATSTSTTDFALELTVSGVGFGVTKSRQLGVTNKIPVDGRCLQIRYRVTLKKELCKKRDGKKFTRYSVDDIQQSPFRDEQELTGAADGCGLPIASLKKLGQDKPFHVVKKQDTTLQVQTGKTITFGLEPSLGGISAKAQVQLSLLKQTQYDYTLTGPHNYVPYLPMHKLAYHWSWN